MEFLKKKKIRILHTEEEVDFKVSKDLKHSSNQFWIFLKKNEVFKFFVFSKIGKNQIFSLSRLSRKNPFQLVVLRCVKHVVENTRRGIVLDSWFRNK